MRTIVPVVRCHPWLIGFTGQRARPLFHTGVRAEIEAAIRPGLGSAPSQRETAQHEGQGNRELMTLIFSHAPLCSLRLSETQAPEPPKRRSAGTRSVKGGIPEAPQAVSAENGTPVNG